jgi:hypothetical protein
MIDLAMSGVLGPEGEAKFTPAIYPVEGGVENPKPFNEEPIELTIEEYQLMRRAEYPQESEPVKAIMEAKGIPYGEWVKVKVEDRTLIMTTDPEDFGTATEV